MAKRRLPPPTGPMALHGARIRHYAVGDWCPSRDGTGPAEAVAFSLNVEFASGSVADLVMRLKTPGAVDTLIQSLLRHKCSVWPDSP